MCSRFDEVNKFVQFFKTSPSGTLLVIGPDGSGKSTILKQAINESSNQMVYLLDLRKFSITTEDEFMYQFVESSGYLLPNTELFARWLLREQVSKTRRIPKIEVDKAITALQNVLLEEKNNAWKNGIPIICIIGMETVQVQKKPELSADEYESNITKFLNFCTYVSDARLCHVVLVTTWSFAHNILDRNSAWFLRRELVDINYADIATISKYLKQTVNDFLKNEGKNQLDAFEIEYITKNIGGNITDINTIITDLMRGDNPLDAVDRLVLDSIKKVTWILENILTEAFSTQDKDRGIFLLEKYLRFWEMMNLFSQVNAVSRTHMIRSIFLGQPNELDEYEKENIVCYWQKKSDNQSKDEIKNRVKLSSLVVIPGSQRILVAFQLILGDSRMKEQYIRTEWILRKKQLAEKKKKLVEDTIRVHTFRKDYQIELWKLLELETKLRDTLGDEAFEKNKKETIQFIEKYTNKVQKCDSLISDIDKLIHE